MSPETQEQAPTPDQLKIQHLEERVSDLLIEKAGWKVREKELEELTVRDALTGAYNQRGAEDMIRVLLPRKAEGNKQEGGAIMERPPVTIAMFDLDNFGKFNKEHGQLTGNKVLKGAAAELIKEAANVLKGAVRGSDVVARIGGEEFLVIFPNATKEDIERALLDPETRRLRLGFTTTIEGQEVRVSFSGGVTEVKQDESVQDFEKIFQRANDAMKEAKKRGKDQILHSDETEVAAA